MYVLYVVDHFRPVHFRPTTKFYGGVEGVFMVALGIRCYVLQKPGNA